MLTENEDYRRFFSASVVHALNHEIDGKRIDAAEIAERLSSDTHVRAVFDSGRSPRSRKGKRAGMVLPFPPS
ncbi:MAG: hypothetical protein VYE73_01980 [Acidobacteriota bacterium]|nr:hypothetical protein [Acidobacteriota bacterium]